MKIKGNIEISGIQRIVFYKKNVFDKIPTFTRPNGYYWYDCKRNQYISVEKMAQIIKGMCVNPRRKVWVEMGTVNIDRIEKKKKKRNDLKSVTKPVSNTYIEMRQVQYGSQVL